MPVTLAQPPQAVETLTRDKVSALAERNELRVAPLVGAKAATLKLSSGHAVHNVGLRDLVAGTPLDKLGVTSWRFIVDGGHAESTAAETIGGAGTQAPEFSSVNAGPFVAGTVDAFASVAKDPTFAAGAWESRVLRIPALYILAVWTHATDGGQDRIKPISPVPAYLDGSKSYTWDEFLAAVRPEAEKKLAADDGLRG